MSETKKASAQLGITEEALIEIRRRVAKNLRNKAMALIQEQQRVPAARYGYWAARFGQRFSFALKSSFNLYVDLLTHTVIQHGAARNWKPIFDDAETFCGKFERVENCGRWLFLAFGRVGKPSKKIRSEVSIPASVWRPFETQLPWWRHVALQDDPDRLSSLEKRAQEFITHKFRLEPQIPGGARAEANKRSFRQSASSPLPTIKEFRAMGVITQKFAAACLRCTPRSIRTYVGSGRLKKGAGGRIICDDSWTRMVRQRRDDFRLE